MSGIFKSIKKIFKKVGKVIKKIAPYLIIAAGVYFGGSYLMSTYGGATAGAAGSAATSFTKSAGVWKSFLGGLTNGSAAQSAAAFAEASYQASIGTGALSLSGQVAAGTSAVNSLNGVLSTQQAVSAGVNFAKGAWSQAGGDPQSGWNIIFKGLNQSQAINANLLPVNEAGSSAITTATEKTTPFISKGGGGEGGEYAYFNGEMQWVPDVPVTTTSSTVAGAPSADIVPRGDVTGGVGLMADAGESAAEVTRQAQISATGSASGGIFSNEGYLKVLQDGLAQNRESNDRMYAIMENTAAKREEANKRQLLWSMAQTGLKAVGGYMTASAERKEANRARNWSRDEDKPMWDPWSGEHRKGIITEQV